MTKDECKELIQANPCYCAVAVALYYKDNDNPDPNKKWKEEFAKYPCGKEYVHYMDE
ncbi:MAG: hypothetical protein VCA13_05730 [PS1 clade bacterium]|jgi:hypothetical protein|tara:strand:- start:47 stop:217 length:171 start_codon:yes stop_codon:yes gene_type:complete